MFLNCSFFSLFILLYLVIVIGSPAPPLLEEMTSVEDLLDLQCTVFDYDGNFRVHFLCIFQKEKSEDDRCFEDCVQTREKHVPIECSREMVGGNVVFRYTSRKSMLPSSSFQCSYKGQNSVQTFHDQEKALRNISQFSSQSSSQGPAISRPTNSKSTEPTASTEPVSFQMSRKEGILLLLFLLTCSMVLNLFCCVRCLISRQYGYLSHKDAPKNPCLSTCLCIEGPPNGFREIQSTKENMYDNIRDMTPGSDTSRNMLMGPPHPETKMTRSSTFPFQQSVLVHNPPGQLGPLQPYMVPYMMVEDGGSQCVMAPLPGHKLYNDDHVLSSNPSSSIRPFSSTGSLDHRPKRSSHMNGTPLSEEGVPFVPNDFSSIYDLNSSQGTCISGKESDSLRDPVRSAKLEMSREMMAKADTLLREAHHLLKEN